MEAMADEKLVLAPAITGIPELVEHGRTGFLYPSGSCLISSVQCNGLSKPSRHYGRWSERPPPTSPSTTTAGEISANSRTSFWNELHNRTTTMRILYCNKYTIRLAARKRICRVDPPHG